MLDNKERNISELIHKLSQNGFDQNEIELIIKVMRTWALLKDTKEINDALTRGLVMVDHFVAFRNAMKYNEED